MLWLSAAAGPEPHEQNSDEKQPALLIRTALSDLERY